MAGNTPQKKYAAVGNPTINAVIKALYRFPDEASALKRLDTLKSHFVVSKQSTAEHTLLMWIRGFEVTPEEAEQNYTGNFALMSCQPIKGGKYTLSAVKVNSDVKQHPQRKRPKRSHPDWGHPIMMAIQKRKIYSSLEKAQRDLTRLHEEYPDASIPSDNRLLIIVYEKTEGLKSPVQKYKMEIKAVSEGYYIDFKKNTKNVLRKPVEKQEAVGQFTAMVALKRKKKPKPQPNSEDPS